MAENLTISDLKIPGKRGPFSIIELGYDEAFSVLFNTDAKLQNVHLSLRVLAAALVDGKGNRVYGDTSAQLEKMKKDIRPGAALIALGMKAFKLNQCDAILNMAADVEGAEKN